MAAVLAVGAEPLAAATILERTVTVDIQGADRFVERVRMRVRMDSAADAADWSVYPIRLNKNRKLEGVEAFAIHADGRRDRVKRRHKDRVEYSGDLLHSSASFEILELPGLGTGSVIDISYTLEVRPYFPASTLWLRGEEPVEKLSVRVVGGGSGMRWQFLGPHGDLEASVAEGALTVRGNGLEGVIAPARAPEEAQASYLLVAWSEDATWAGVARWYEGVASGLARGDPQVRGKARELIAEATSPRERLESLLAYLRRQIRYVAVEVGIGGYRPSPPGEVLERRWGDCKDKSLLLLDLLREAEIEAYPALILSARRGRVRSEFPSPTQFNHMIVAIPEGEVSAEGDDPVGDGFFFVDPTQTRGTAGWLHPGVQDQHALVVTGRGGTLARTPQRPQHERREMTVTLTVKPDGSANGGAALSFVGSAASGVLHRFAAQPSARNEEETRGLFSALVPAARLGPVSWAEQEGEVPTIHLTAQVGFQSLVQGLESGAPSFEAVALESLPEPSALVERETAVVIAPRLTSTVWNITLPEGLCPPGQTARTVENSLGALIQTVRHRETPGSFSLERELEIRRRWVEADGLDELQELALAEYRANRRRIRLTCG